MVKVTIEMHADEGRHQGRIKIEGKPDAVWTEQSTSYNRACTRAGKIATQLLQSVGLEEKPKP